METRIKTALDGFRKSVLDAHGMDFLIVGSLALHELGMETGEPHDIDMEVKCTPEQEQSIFKLRLDHPDIVMAQCIEESGGFTSKLFVEGNNCLGMKVPGSRPTLAVGTMLGHARFNSWRECIADYAIWQSTFARRLTKDEYFAYLDRVYAEKKGYSGRLKAIIQSRGL